MIGGLSSLTSRARYDFESWRDRKPTKLLLGRKEMEWLNEEARAARFVGTLTGPPTRATYQGMEVYPVDDAEFLGVL